MLQRDRNRDIRQQSLSVSVIFEKFKIFSKSLKMRKSRWKNLKIFRQPFFLLYIGLAHQYQTLYSISTPTHIYIYSHIHKHIYNSTPETVRQRECNRVIKEEREKEIGYIISIKCKNTGCSGMYGMYGRLRWCIQQGNEFS